MEYDNYPGHILDLLVAFWLSGLGIVEGGSGIQVLMLFQLSDLPDSGIFV